MGLFGLFDSTSNAEDARQAGTDNARVVGKQGVLTEQGGITLSGKNAALKYTAPGAVDLSNARVSTNKSINVSGASGNVTIDTGGEVAGQLTNTFAGLVEDLSTQNSAALSQLVASQSAANQLLTQQLSTTNNNGQATAASTATDDTATESGLGAKLKAWWANRTDTEKRNLKLAGVLVILAGVWWFFFRKR